MHKSGLDCSTPIVCLRKLVFRWHKHASDLSNAHAPVYAVAGDNGNNFLVVLAQSHPFQKNPVCRVDRELPFDALRC